MENHIAREHHIKAGEYAKEALRRNPKLREAYGELVWAMDGKVADWNAANHCVLIDYLEGFIQDHPDSKNAYLDIMEQLMDDYRFEEAAAYCDKYAELDNSYRVPLYRGKIAWYDGRREEAFAIWEEMEKNFPEEWCVYHNMADFYTRSRRYSEAEVYYRKAIDIQKAPRYADPFEALAQFYEMRGDYRAAVCVLKEELDVFDKEWHFTAGETADMVYREIELLQKKL